MTADIYTHTSAEAERETAIALERAIYGDVWKCAKFETVDAGKALRGCLRKLVSVLKQTGHDLGVGGR
jgi:hypothetical protein